MQTIDTTRLPRGGPALALVMRSAFALLAQALVAAGLRRRGHPAPWQAAAAWWIVHSSLADIGCLLVLRALLHREGLRLRDIAGFERKRVRADLKEGLKAVAAQSLAAGISTALTRPFYPDGVPPLISIVRVPWWARLYGALVWPPLWVYTEELVYLGYALPRLEAQLGSTPAAATLVILAWGPLQHPTLPALPDRRHIAYRALTALPPITGQVVFFLSRGRRLPPLMFAHWLADFATGVMIATRPQDGQVG
jgi:uncharacterized protein